MVIKILIDIGYSLILVSYIYRKNINQQLSFIWKSHSNRLKSPKNE